MQGQLEHPSIVPVYDIGKNPEGEDFFTMKRVNGLTLEEILGGLGGRDPEITAFFSRRKLLGAMSQVCLSVAYAHRRGLVHRDLKPANVMLGDFGEVYVLDWGVARIRGEAEIELDDPSVASEHGLVQTEAGAVVGTPGYMAPEQARGEDSVGPQSDVYALGAILFELLSSQPFHQGKTVQALLGSTLTQRPVAPSSWAPDSGIAPELDDICLRALALDPSERFPTARELHDAIERYLDGERDAERRREQASAHLERARSALERATEGGPVAEAARAEGMRELSRALALDPTDESALATISDLVMHGELPPEGEAELRAVELRDRAVTAERGSRAAKAWFLAVPVLFWMGIKSSTAFALFIGCVVAMALGQHFLARTGKVEPRWMRFILFGHLALILATSTLFGPLVYVPAFAVIMASSYVTGVRANRRTRSFAYGVGVFGVFAAYLLQRFGVMPPAYAFEDGVIKILPVMVQFPPLQTELLLVGATAVQLVVPGMLIGKAVDALVTAERDNFRQAFRLRQLLPGDRLRGATDPPPNQLQALAERARVSLRRPSGRTGRDT